MSQDSDDILVQQMAEGSESAFVQLITRYRKRVFSHALAFTHRPEEAEELTQDIFVKLWQQRQLLPDVQRVEDFIFILSRNYIFSHLRKRIETTILIDSERHIDDLALPDTQLELKELEQLIADGIQRMPPQQQAVFLLSRQEGLTYEQIAQRLSISKDTVKWHIKVGLQHLRQYIRQHDAVLFTVLLCLHRIAG